MLAHSLIYLKNKWFGNTRNDLLSGTLVALALIPEAIAFSIIAGVDPKVGLYASFCIAVIIAFVGGRSGMISAATGAMALVMVTLVKNHGLEYLFAATVLTGILQIAASFLKFGSIMRFISRSVVTGFVNALAILIFMAQLPEFKQAGIELYSMVALGLAIIYILPRYIKSIPSPLICIIVLTLMSVFLKLDLRTVGDMGHLPNTLPNFLIPNVPMNFETLRIILPYALSLTAVGLLESLMTATIVDDMTATDSCKNQECRGQGIANLVCGFFGGMAGCGMIGQSVINVKAGGRSRLSTLWAGLFLLFLILVLGDWVKQIPMAALVAVMIMVSIGTFNWSFLKNITSNSKASTLVTIATVMTVIMSHNLAIGVFVGVLVGFIFKKIAKYRASYSRA
ncbi:MAG: Bicarbonate transporter BicA [Chlamydiae bacterium]|nr:Bicarbonate transporter BicA [Chlamydiota bacterium]